jgi:DNA-binding transcriptional MerR regulator
MSDGMTVTDIAALVGMTPRNIRSYQSRGLLFPPQIQDRKARYTGAHVARLELIASLQREGFTLAAIKRLLEHPDSYASVIDERRRRFRDKTSDMPASVPVTELSLAAVDTKQRAALIEHGLLWQHEGGLRTHTLLAGMSRTLREQGVSGELITELLLDVAKVGTQVGAVLCGRIGAETVPAAGATHAASAQRRADLALLGAQLLATGFGVTCARAATAEGTASRPPRR